MLWFSVKYFITTIFLINCVDSTLLKCLHSSGCSCTIEDGYTFDLSPLKASGPFRNEAKNVTFQPCKNIDLTFSGFPATANTSECNSTSICMLNGKNESINLGSTEEASWSVDYIEDKGRFASLMYNHANRQTKITLSCTSTGISFLSSVPGNGTIHEYLLHSPHACAVPTTISGLSTGSVLCILLLVFSSLYLIGGAIALRIFRGAVGMELIPNLDFWSGLPSLVTDGVTFALSGCSAVSYDRI